MMQEWSALNVKFMRDASEYHPEYYQALAKRVLAQIDDVASVCDAGCGEGYLDLAMAPLCGQITAVDIVDRPLAVLRENIRKANISNITVFHGDVCKLQPETKYTAMIFCYFGTMPEPLRIARRQCDGTLVIVTRNYSTHRFTLGEKAAPRDTVPSSASVLEQLGIPFQAENCTIEFGQPFRSLKEAVQFFESYNAERTQQVDAQQVEARLIRTNREDFPLYLPMRKEMGILTVKTMDIPAYLGETE